MAVESAHTDLVDRARRLAARAVVRTLPVREPLEGVLAAGHGTPMPEGLADQLRLLSPETRLELAQWVDRVYWRGTARARTAAHG